MKTESTIAKITLGMVTVILFSIVGVIIINPFTRVNAQVTIGSGEVPQSFSVLELISNQKFGLRLPQLSEYQRDRMTEQPDFIRERRNKALGLMIFNTDTYSVETWDGTGWITINNKPSPEITVLKNDMELLGNDLSVKIRVMDNTELNAIKNSPDFLNDKKKYTGTFIYNSTSRCFQFYNGTAWINFCP